MGKRLLSGPLSSVLAWLLVAAFPLALTLHLPLHSTLMNGKARRVTSGRSLLQAQHAVDASVNPQAALQGNTGTPGLASDATAVPMPMAFFPLNGPELHSLIGNYTGTVHGASFVYSEAVGLKTLRCDKGTNSTVVIQNIPYGRNGSWAINFWLRPKGAVTGVESVYTHTAAKSQQALPSLWGPNQVKVYFPGTQKQQLDDPYAGILRAVVKDNDDIYIDESTVTFLDSNGQVSNLVRVQRGEVLPQNVSDGGWHMVTLTTHASGGPGFQMFLDGKLVAHMEPGLLYDGADGEHHVATGGGPLEINNNIFLCGDPAVNVHGQVFDGSLLELAIWDRALTDAAISAFYRRHFANQEAANASAPQLAAAGGTAPGPSQEIDTQQMQLQALLNVPDPKAYFPLTSGSLNSVSNYGSFTYGGRGYNISWVKDNKIGTVLSCSKHLDSTVILDPVAYGGSGQWAISLWFRPTPAGLAGNQFEYLFSQVNREQLYPTGWEQNQVRIYFPQLGHVGYGVIRALVKDSIETSTGPESQTFLDSDGMVGQLVRNTSSKSLRDVGAMLQDGQWHMISLTTLVGENGFAMYLDGNLVGELNATTAAVAGFQSVDGGQRMDLDGNIFLCGRSLGDAARGYDGQLAELSIFDTSLSPMQMKSLYYTGLGAPPQAAEAPEAASSPSPLPVASPTVSPIVRSAAEGLWTINERTICILAPITEVPLQACPPSEVCAAVAAIVIQAAKLPTTLREGDIGVCVPPPSGGLLLPKYSVVPPPRSFYPLTNDLNTYPLALLSGRGSGAYLAAGGPFGHSVRCLRAEMPDVLLDSPPYAALAGFTVNFWFSAADVSGDGLQYIFSQANAGTLRPDGSGPNQVQIFFPGQGNPGFGALLAAVADSTDNSAKLSLLSTEGAYTDTVPHVLQNSGKLKSHASLTDGRWHMVTITSQPNGTRGYRLYLDGHIVGEVASGLGQQDGAASLPINGGDAINLPDRITLCSRYDNDSKMHYDGSLAYLGLYDSGLKPDQVHALYDAVINSTLPGGGPAPSTTATNLMTKSGVQCAVPLGPDRKPAWPDCPLVQGVRACPVEAGQWEPCRDLPPPIIEPSLLPPATAPLAQALDLPTPADEAKNEGTPDPGRLMTSDGHQCLSPVDYDGTSIHGCVMFAAVPGTPLCWTTDVRNGSWSVCKAGSQVSVQGISTAIAQSRVTSGQQPCILPIVHEGKIITDCVFDLGSMSCPASSGDWVKCASKADVQQPRVPLVVPPYYQPNGFFVTNRTTVNGEVCRLPLMYNGSVITNCGGPKGDYCVGETSSSWQKCIPVAPGTAQRLTLQEVADSPNGFPAKGGPGGFCIPNIAEALTGKQRGCQPGLTCIPLPVQPPVKSNGMIIAADVANVGYCSPSFPGSLMISRAYRPVVSFQIPQPTAFFPLTGRLLRTVTLPFLQGQAIGVTWNPDSRFHSVLTCARASNSSVKLEGTNFTGSGSWTLNLWFKRLPGKMDDDIHNSLGYLFSQSAENSKMDPSAPNQIQILMPGAADPSYGVVRAVVKDSRDAPIAGVESHVFLDTDGQINNNGRPNNMTNPCDQEWHMLTLSTQPSNFAGYRLFLDGSFVGQLFGDSKAVDQKASIQIGGGSPIMDGPIFLCGRGDSSQVFDGSIANLALFDMILTDAQIQAMYQAYTSGPDPVQAPEPSAEAPTPAIETAIATADAPVAPPVSSPTPMPSSSPTPIFTAAPAITPSPTSAPTPMAATPSPQSTGDVSTMSAQEGNRSHAHPKSRGGAVAGGIAGALVGAALLACLIYLLYRCRRKKRFVPFKDSPPVYKLPDGEQKLQDVQLELSKSPHIERLEATGFGGPIPPFPAASLQDAHKMSIPAAKASKWEIETDDEDDFNDPDPRDTAMTAHRISKFGRGYTRKPHDRNLLSNWERQQQQQQGPRNWMSP